MTKTARKSAKKTTKPRKAEKTVKAKASRLEHQIVQLKKMGSEEELPKQAIGILHVLKANGGKLAANTLVAKLEGHIETKQSLAAIWSFYRARLMKDGYVAIEEQRE